MKSDNNLWKNKYDELFRMVESYIRHLHKAEAKNKKYANLCFNLCELSWRLVQELNQANKELGLDMPKELKKAYDCKERLESALVEVFCKNSE